MDEWQIAGYERAGRDKLWTAMEDPTTDSPSDSPEPRDESKVWMRFAGLGMELASYTIAMMAIGYAIDSHRGHAKPLCTAFGTLIGFSFGMFRFIQRASKASRNN